MKRIFLILSIALLAIFTGCDKNDDVLIPDNDEVVAQEESKGTLKSTNAYLNVPYLSQVNNGVVGFNCGHTCVVMVAAYYGKVYQPLSFYNVIQENQWLMLNHPQNYDGDYFNTGESVITYTTSLRALLKDKHGLSGPGWNYYHYNDISQMKTDLSNGKPCIASVYANSNGLTSYGGQLHWVVVIGYGSGNFRIHDPWNYNGGIARSYTEAQFLGSYNRTPRIHMPVSN